ncbi:uncharacterized protein LOC126667948 [Mercurialis annua]|uniref:uncharacterized protein LOC126667948 n=1 Tax=Mercurialis annua TaxID=3986 RepID=UPI00215DD4D6|nr:uncharacterized protein LOC126667948 [Mercurialis annua]
MAQAARLNLRMQKELKLLLTDPPHGASFPFLSPDHDLSSLSTIDAQIQGPEGTVYAKGIFNVKIQIPDRYPFQPPSVTFATPVYHPNIDNGGRICLDVLNLPPKGAWQPSLNISTVLTSIGLLLSEPNPDDGLMCEASKEYKYNRQVFDQKAQAMVEKYAKAGHSDHSCRTQSVQSNVDKDAEVEVKHLERESRHELNHFASNDNKPCGISRKLSLDPSNSKLKTASDDGEADKVPNPPQVCSEKIGVKTERNEVSNGPIKTELRNERIRASGNVGKLSLLQGGSLNELQHHRHHNAKLTHDSKFTSSEKLYQVSQKVLPGSFDAGQTGDGNNDNMLVSSAAQPFQSHSNSSPGASATPSSIGHIGSKTSQDPVLKTENGLTDADRRKVCPVRKKLSLGVKGFSEGQENVMLMHNRPISNAGISSKLSLGPLTQLQGGNGDNGQLSSEHQITKLTTVIKECREESPVAESVIVLDSEDSDEENNGSMRFKPSLVRKRTVKRKAQAM